MIESVSDRQDYPCLKSYSYLNQASLGLIGGKAVSAMHNFLDETARHGNLHMSDEEEASFINPLRLQIGTLLNAEIKNIAITSSASEILSQLPELLSPKIGNKIILVSTDFPAITRPWIAYAKKNHLTLSFVDQNDNESLTETIIKNIDKQTDIVCVSFVQFSNGTRLNIPKLRAATVDLGIKLIVDITQAAGAIPISINDWSADVVVCSGYKWLGGHGGIAFAILSDELLNNDPPSIGWFNGENPFDMNATELALAKSAAKYTQSTLSYISVIGLKTALDELLAMDIHEIEAHSCQLANIFIAGLRTLNWKPFLAKDAQEFSSHIISISSPTLDVQEALKHLRKNGIICSARNGSIRVSIAHYNNQYDIQSLLDNL